MGKKARSYFFFKTKKKKRKRLSDVFLFDRTNQYGGKLSGRTYHFKKINILIVNGGNHPAGQGTPTFLYKCVSQVLSATITIDQARKIFR